MDIRGEKSSKDMASSRLKIWVGCLKGEEETLKKSIGFLSALQKSLGFENCQERFTEYPTVTLGFDPYVL